MILRDEKVPPNRVATIGRTWHNAAFLLLQTLPESFRSNVRFSERVFWWLACMWNVQCLEAETFPFMQFYSLSTYSSTMKFFFTWDFPWKLLIILCSLGSSICIATLHFILCYNCCLWAALCWSLSRNSEVNGVVLCKFNMWNKCVLRHFFCMAWNLSVKYVKICSEKHLQLCHVRLKELIWRTCIAVIHGK